MFIAENIDGENVGVDHYDFDAAESVVSEHRYISRAFVNYNKLVKNT